MAINKNTKSEAEFQAMLAEAKAKGKTQNTSPLSSEVRAEQIKPAKVEKIAGPRRDAKLIEASALIATELEKWSLKAYSLAQTRNQTDPKINAVQTSGYLSNVGCSRSCLSIKRRQDSHAHQRRQTYRQRDKDRLQKEVGLHLRRHHLLKKI